MRRNTLLRLLGVPVLVVGVGSMAAAIDTTWTGGGDGTSWTDGGNWDGGAPGTGVDAIINSGATTTGGETVIEDGPLGTDGAKSLTINGGSLTNGPDTWLHLGKTTTGVLTQTGGTVDLAKYGMVIGGAGVVPNANGLYDMQGGTLTNTGQGGISLSDDDSHTTAVGELRISGNSVVDLGRMFSENGGTILWKGGISIMTVSGSDATINVDSLQMLNVSPDLPERNILRFEFDAGGVTPITVTGDWTGPDFNFPHWTGGAPASLGAGYLDLVDLGDAVPGTYTVMTADFIKDGGFKSPSTFSLDPSVDTSRWSFEIVGTRTMGDGQLDEMVVTLIPEPSTLVLLCIAAAGMLLSAWRRKRS